MTSTSVFFESLVRSLAEKHHFEVAEDAVERDPSGDSYRVTLFDPVVDETVSFRVAERDVALASLNTAGFSRAVARQVESARRRVDQRILGPQPEPDVYTPTRKVYGPW